MEQKAGATVVHDDCQCACCFVRCRMGLPLQTIQPQRHCLRWLGACILLTRGALSILTSTK